MKPFFNAAISAAVLGALPFVVQAQTTLLGWDVNGVSENASTLSAQTIAPNISTSSSSGVLSKGSGVGIAGNPSINTFGGSGFTEATLSSALSANDYFSFTITPSSGYSATLSSVTFKMSTTTNGPTSAALFSSVGGFSSTSNAISSWTLTGGTNSDQSITLSSSSFSDLTTSVEFRIYAYAGTGSATTDKFRFRNLTGDDLQITGTVSAIPEPSTYAGLAGAAALVSAMYLRRRRSR